MKIGVVFPQTEIGSDIGVIRSFVQTAENLEYQNILAYDHVIGADTKNRPGWNKYSIKDSFYEPFTLFSYFAALTTKINLTTGIIILPQRQTVLVAKQASVLDVLSQGRLHLGVAIGWNDVEFEALGENFNNRGVRIEEQVSVLRSLWTENSVSFRGQWHSINEAGISPLPIQQPIPIWFGGGMTDNQNVLKRIARLADGWIMNQQADKGGEIAIAKMKSYLSEIGRDSSKFGFDGRVSLVNGISNAVRLTKEWERIGATQVNLNTMNSNLLTPEAHIKAIQDYKIALGQVNFS